jgi:hypothetical protein
MESGGVKDEPDFEQTEEVLSSDSIEFIADPLEDLPEDSLLALIGAYSLTPGEQTSTALLRHAPEELNAPLLQQGIIVDASVDLVTRGRRTVERVMADWGDELREKICPLRARRGMRRAELVANVAAVLAILLSAVAGVIAAIAVFIVRFSLDELCDGWPGRRPIVPATA